MLTKLRIENGIKYKDRTFEFEKGLTVIHGANGNGKSLIQEFIRFALFGSGALRGKTSDYPSDMRITLLFDGTEIRRTIKDCIIKSGDTEVKGTTACNKWIIRRFGFGLNVFDMSNCSKQGEISKLGRMLPSERKQAIDDVIGISVIRKMIVKLRDEKNSLKNYCDGMEAGLTEPVAPSKPEKYENSSVLHSRAVEARTNRVKWEEAEKHRCEEPHWEGEFPKGKSEDEGLYNFLISAIKGTEDMKEPDYTREDIDKLYSDSIKWLDWKEPSMSYEEASDIVKQWDMYNSSKVKCPHCGTEFSPVWGITKKPTVDLAIASNALQAWRFKPQCEKPAELMDNKTYTEKSEYLRKWKQVSSYRDELKEFEGIDWKRVKLYEQYKEDKKRWDEYCRLKEGVRPPLSDSEIEALESLATECRLYESLKSKYDTEIKDYENKIKRIEEGKARIEELDKGINGLQNFSAAVKNGLTPSISKVASDISSKITSGKISEIRIADDFSITADGKEIRLLSGGEEAVVNLAIRLALSSVLTRKAFNVFIGDEIDQSMDDERASATADTLRELSSYIDQVILISHKRIDSEHEIVV